MEPSELLAALQLADPSLPVGRFAHSHGLEALLAADGDLVGDGIFELAESVVLEVAGPLDGAAAALASRARSRAELIDLDRAVTVRRLTPASRAASSSCGRRLAALAPLLVAQDPARGFCGDVEERRSDGNLSVVEGAVAGALGVDDRGAATLAVRGSAGALLSAAVRLGRLSASRAQAILRQLEPAMVTAVGRATAATADTLRATSPELDVYALAHARAPARSFIT